jgi:predicted S18 family serine protease
MSARSILVLGIVFHLMASTAIAGPYRDAEDGITNAYAEYRKALFQTNQNNKAATEAALSAFRLKWQALAIDWKKAAPPQYADDPQFLEVIEKVSTLANDAASQAAENNLAKSHDTLEGIRDLLGELRRRNGIINFSDRMNSYHAHMEHILEHNYSSLAQLSEDAAALAFLAADIKKNRPKGVDNLVFDEVMKEIDTSIDTLRKAARSGDADAIEKARKGLKSPYSRMFIRFG